MNFTVTTENLLAGLKRVQNAVSNKPMLAILNNILITAKDGKVWLTAYDGEMRIKTAIPAAIVEEGSVALQAKRLIGTIASLPLGEVVFETGAEEADMVCISCSKVNFHLRGMDATTFPEEDSFTEDWKFSINGRAMVDCMKKVIYARSEDESRKALNGVLFSLKDGINTVVASDGRRLALIERKTEGEEGSDVASGNFILPCKTVMELCSSIDQGKPVNVHLSSASALFENGDTTIISKLVDNNYPNYRSVIPVYFQQQMVVPRAVFAEVLKRAKMVMDEKSENCSVILEIQSSQMTVSASSESSDMSESIDVELTGEPITLSFNPDYLMDPIKALSSDNIILKFNSASTPVAMTGDEGFIYILMPLRA